MKRVLITGGTGFVGANLARRMLVDGHEVHILVREKHKTWRIKEIRDDLRIHCADLEDDSLLAAVVAGVRPDWVFHLAAHGAYSWQTDASSMVKTNIAGTMNLLQTCLKTGFEAFVNTGSSSEYGFKDHAPSEEEYLEPNSNYAVTKASQTLWCDYMARNQGARLVTLRLYSVYGPYEEPGRLMPALICHGLHGKLPPLANPGVARDYIYVDDAVEAYVQAAARLDRKRGSVYNVGTGIQTCLREVVDVARRVLEVRAEPDWKSMPGRSWDTELWVSEIGKIQEDLDWTPQYSFERGFRSMVVWFRENTAVRDVYRKSYELS